MLHILAFKHIISSFLFLGWIALALKITRRMNSYKYAHDSTLLQYFSIGVMKKIGKITATLSFSYKDEGRCVISSYALTILHRFIIILTGNVKIHIHYNIMSRHYIADSQVSKVIHGIVIVLLTRFIDQIENKHKSFRQRMRLNEVQILILFIILPHYNQNDISTIQFANNDTLYFCVGVLE